MTRLLGLAAALRDPCGELPAHQPLLPPALLRRAGGEVCSCRARMHACVNRAGRRAQDPACRVY